ncbi:MAG TPA: hypothetical protein VGJ25_01760 [Gaiellaceae bacterium]|jgi:hypothetical protein
MTRLAVLVSALVVGVTWTAVRTPNKGALPNALNGVAVLSPTSA